MKLWIYVVEFGTYTPWSSWKEDAVKGVKMLKRTRSCTSDECSEETTETKACTPLLCSGIVLSLLRILFCLFLNY